MTRSRLKNTTGLYITFPYDTENLTIRVLVDLDTIYILGSTNPSGPPPITLLLSDDQIDSRPSFFHFSDETSSGEFQWIHNYFDASEDQFNPAAIFYSDGQQILDPYPLQPLANINNLSPILDTNEFFDSDVLNLSLSN
jgi:hypothetical protein